MKQVPPDYFSKDYFFGGKKSNYVHYDRWDNNRFWKSIIDAVKKYRMNGKALDVGCAFGFLLKRLEPFFSEAHGVDISEFAINEAKKVVPTAHLKILDIDTQELPYPAEYFDLITALDVLEHTKSIERSLNKILPKLKNNGFLVMSVPLKNTLFGRLFHYFDKDKSHISIPNKKELFNLIKSINLEILEKRYFFPLIYAKFWGIPVCIELVLRKK